MFDPTPDGGILKAFQMYYETAQLESVTDPQLVFNLRDKIAKETIDSLNLFKTDMGTFKPCVHVPVASLRLREH